MRHAQSCILASAFLPHFAKNAFHICVFFFSFIKWVSLIEERKFSSALGRKFLSALDLKFSSGLDGLEVEFVNVGLALPTLFDDDKTIRLKRFQEGADAAVGQA